MYFTTNHLKEICGMSQSTLSGWVRNGVVDPVVKGQDGRGNAHKFTLLQAVAVSYARQFQEAGCPPPILASVVKLVSNLSAEELEEHFNRGETVLYPLPGTPVWFDPSTDPNPTREQRLMYHRLDLEAVYNRVLERSEKLVMSNGKT